MAIGKTHNPSTKSSAGRARSVPVPSKRPADAPNKIPVPSKRPSTDQVSLSRDSKKTETGASASVAAITAGLQDASPASTAGEAIGKVLDQDHKDWGGQTTTSKGVPLTPGHREDEKGFSDRVGEYFRGTALAGTTGKDRDVPWSAAYISSVHERAGVTNFPASIRHSTYINNAIEARKNGDKQAPYLGYRPSERAPQVGDLVCFNRGNGTASFDDQRGGQYPSHCDFVKAVNPGSITTQGGNVGDSVSTRQFTTDASGLLNDKSQRWIAVLGPQNLEMK